MFADYILFDTDRFLGQTFLSVNWASMADRLFSNPTVNDDDDPRPERAGKSPS